MTENITNNYEQIFNKERNDFFKLGGIHSGNYKRAKASYNAILLEYPDPKEWTTEIQQKANDIAKEVEFYYNEAKKCKYDNISASEDFDRVEFIHETLYHRRTILKLRRLSDKWTRTYNTLVRDFIHWSVEECTPERRQMIVDFVKAVWNHSYER